jgi:hypothetical protein
MTGATLGRRRLPPGTLRGDRADATRSRDTHTRGREHMVAT